MSTTVIIAIGSNKPHGRHGSPEAVVRAAVSALEEQGIEPVRLSRIYRTPPLGPSSRRYANAVVVAHSGLPPLALLRVLKGIERSFGRRRGREWGARVIDLDLIAWGGDIWPGRWQWRHSRHLAVPHRAMHERRFVLDPLVEVAGEWVHPLLNRTARQLHGRLRRARAAHPPD